MVEAPAFEPPRYDFATAESFINVTMIALLREPGIANRLGVAMRGMAEIEAALKAPAVGRHLSESLRSRRLKKARGTIRDIQDDLYRIHEKRAQPPTHREREETKRTGKLPAFSDANWIERMLKDLETLEGEVSGLRDRERYFLQL